MVGLSFQNFKASRDLNNDNTLTNDSLIAKYHKLFKDKASYIRKEDPELIRKFQYAVTPESQDDSAVNDLGV